MNPTVKKIILTVGKLTDTLLTILSWVFCPVLTFCILPLGYFDPRKRTGIAWWKDLVDEQQFVDLETGVLVTVVWLICLALLLTILYNHPFQVICAGTLSIISLGMLFCYQCYKVEEELKELAEKLKEKEDVKK